MRLFAEQGFRETTVGDIESAVGLQPRRGALYRHFESKEALLHAALARHLAAIGAVAPAADDSVAVDVATEAAAVGRWLLAELDRERVIMRILEQEGDRLTEVRDTFRERLVDVGYREVAGLLRRWLRTPPRTVDVDALSVVVLGALVNYRRSMWTFGGAPLDVDDERFLRGWAALCAATVDTRGRVRRG